MRGRRFWQLVAAGAPTSRLKIAALRRSGARVGRHVRIRSGAYVIAETIEIGDGVIIEPDVHIVCGTVRMGIECKIDSDTVVYGEGTLIMGDGAYIGPRAWINTAATVRLGKATGVGPGSMVFTHGVWLPYLEGFPRRFEDVVLGDGVWVPANVTILPGVKVGDGVIVGAGSVLNKDVPPHTFVAGVPAKEVSTVEQLKGPGTHEARNLRAREMVEDFARFAERRRWAVGQRSGPALLRFGTKRPGETVVLYAAQRIGLPVLDELLRLRGDARRVILLALTGVEASVKASLQAVHWVDWFDLATHTARRSWHRDTVAFRRYLASHWGLHLTLE